MTIPYGPKVLDPGAWIAAPAAADMLAGHGEANVARMAAPGEG